MIGVALIIFFLIEIFVYDTLGAPLFTLMIALALMWRGEREAQLARTAAPAEEVDRTMTADQNVDRLVRTVGRLWPGHEVALVQNRRRDKSARELIFVPSQASPRLLVPAGKPAAAASGLRRFSTALSSKERAIRLVGSVALRAGAEGLLSDRVRMTPRPGAEPSIEQHLSEVLGTEVVVGLGVGSLRANQKPILQAFDRRGRCVAYVKVGDSELTSGLVQQEGAALAELTKKDWRLLELPALLHLGNWQGLELLVISALDTAVRPSSGPLLQPPLAALDELYDRFDEGTAALGQTPYWQGLLDTAEQVDDARLRTAYQEALDRIGESHGDDLVRLTAWHGDFAPWNLSTAAAACSCGTGSASPPAYRPGWTGFTTCCTPALVRMASRPRYRHCTGQSVHSPPGLPGCRHRNCSVCSTWRPSRRGTCSVAREIRARSSARPSKPSWKH